MLDPVTAPDARLTPAELVSDSEGVGTQKRQHGLLVGTTGGLANHRAGFDSLVIHVAPQHAAEHVDRVCRRPSRPAVGCVEQRQGLITLSAARQHALLAHVDEQAVEARWEVVRLHYLAR